MYHSSPIQNLRYTCRSNAGFTLIELILAILIIGILASVVIPKFSNLKANAEYISEQGIVGAVRTGLDLFKINMLVGEIDSTANTYGGVSAAGYPNRLESLSVPDGPATDAAPFFTSVLSHGGVRNSGWSKDGYVYTGPSGATYEYNPATGSFLQLSASTVVIGGGPGGGGAPGQGGTAAPGVGGTTPPGQGGSSPPGNNGSPPGLESGPPGQGGGIPPGQGSVPPGQQKK